MQEAHEDCVLGTACQDGLAVRRPVILSTYMSSQQDEFRPCIKHVQMQQQTRLGYGQKVCCIHGLIQSC